MSEIVTSADDALLKVSIDNLKDYDVHAGRPPKYEDTETGLERFKADTIRYFEDVRSANTGFDTDDKPLIITVEGWLTSLGLTRQSLSRYRSRGGAWLDFIDFTKENILSCKLQRYYTGQVPPVSAIFDLTNNHHYLSTNNFTATSHTDIEKATKTEYPTLETLKGDTNHD